MARWRKKRSTGGRRCFERRGGEQENRKEPENGGPPAGAAGWQSDCQGRDFERKENRPMVKGVKPRPFWVNGQFQRGEQEVRGQKRERATGHPMLLTKAGGGRKKPSPEGEQGMGCIFVA